MFSIRILLLLSLFYSFGFSKGEVSKIFAHRENAISSGYSINGVGYKWGQGQNIVIDGFEYQGHRYNYVSDSPIIKIRRSDNSKATGEPCGLFAEKKDNQYDLAPTFPQDCDMAAVMGGRIINIGALDLFKNGSNVFDSYDTPKNIERVDFISPNGIIAPSTTDDLEKAGHVVTEKSGNNEIKIAAILSLDSNGDPSSFGPLVTVHDQNRDAASNRKVDYGDTYIYLDDGTKIGTQELGFYRDEKIAPQSHKPTYAGHSTEKMDMAFVSLNDLGISTGQKYYGFAYFASDVDDSMDLVDYNSFPKNTPMNSLHHTDTADPYGGVASYFADEDITKYSISGYIFKDINNNGIKESSEKGLDADSYIKLCTNNDTFIKSIKANNTTGAYILTDIVPGEYKIIEDASNSQDCTTTADANGYISTTTNTLNVDISNNLTDKNFGNIDNLPPDNTKSFICNSDAYLFNGYPYTDAYTIDLSDGNYNLVKSAIQNRINATGYNVKDNLIWGYDINSHKVIKIDADYNVTSYDIPQLPDNSYYAGDVSMDGILYLKTHNNGKIYKINLNSGHPVYDNYITLSDATLNFGDFAFNPIDNMLYGISETDAHLYKIDSNNGNVTDLGEQNILESIQFHTYVFDKNGNLYFYGVSGKIYKIDIGDGTKSSYSVELFSTTDIKKAGGDGARCANADMPPSPTDDINSTGDGICYGLIDNGKKIYEMYLNSDTAERVVNIDKEFVGEGTAYRSINNTLYAFQTLKNGSPDRHGDSSTLYSINLNDTSNPVNVVKLKDNIVANEVEGAEFYYDPISKREILYVLTSIDENVGTIKLHAFYADEWDNEISGYPKNVSGVRLGSLAIDPKTGQGYATEDATIVNPPKVYKLDLHTGVATLVFKSKKIFDSEGLAFAKDGYLYTEDDGEYSLFNRKVYRIDLVNKKYIPVRKLSGTKDIEGLSCNGIASTMPTSPIIPQPIADYHFDECYWDGTVGEVKDSSKNAKHGTSYGHANTVDDAIVGRSGLFNGVFPNDPNQGDFVEIADHALLNKDDAFTVSTWFKAKKLREWNGIVSTLAHDERTGWNIEIDTIHTDSRKGLLTMFGNELTDQNRTSYLTTPIEPALEEWHHIVLVHDTNNTNRVYVDGKYQNSISADIRPSSNPLQIAKFYADKSLDWYFNGQIDEVKLWDTTLTQEEIIDIYNNEKSGKSWDGKERTIVCEDTLKLSINNITKKEGNSGTTDFDFTISLNEPAPKGGITVTYTTKDGTAGDEYDDNVSLPQVYISDVTVTEGDSNTIMTFDVILDKVAPVGGVIVQATPQDDTAIEGTDYSRITSSVYIPQGKMRADLNYTIIGDDIAESTKQFSVVLSAPQNAVINRGTGVGVIYDDDDGDTNTDSSSVSWFDRIKNFFTGGNTISKSSNISSNKSEHQVQKSYNKNIIIQKNNNKTQYIRYQKTNEQTTTTSSNEQNSSSNIADYQKIQGTITINEGEKNATIHVSVNGDEEVEQDETFYVLVLPPSGVTSTLPIGTGTIINDDKSADETIGMLLTKGDGNDDKKTNIYIFDVNISNDTIENFHLLKKLDDEYRSLAYHNGEYLTMGLDGYIYSIDPYTGDLTKDSDYDKIDTNICGSTLALYSTPIATAISFDDDDNVIFEINSREVYKYNKDTKKIEVLNILTNSTNGSLAYWDNNRYATSFPNIGAKNIINGNEEDIVDSHNETSLSGAEIVSNTKAYFINSELNDLSFYASIGDDDWNSFYDYGNGANGNTGGLVGVAVAIPYDKKFEPFICSETLYLSNRTKSGTGNSDSGESWLHSINQSSMPYKFDYIGDGFKSDDGGYNALGYNPKDNFMYALYKTHLLKIDKNATVVDLGEVAGLTTQLYAGTFDREGNYFVANNGGADDKLYKIDIEHKKVIQILPLRYNLIGQSEAVKFWDMAIDDSDQYLYAMLIDNSDDTKNDKFIKIDKNTGVMTVIKDKPTGLSSAIDTIFTDVDGDVFLLEHNSGFYKIDSSNGDLYKLSDTDELTYYNDGANCVDANISEPSTISIQSKVVGFEGDSGSTEFTFDISFSKPAPADAGFWVTYTDGVDAISPMGTAQHIDSHPNDGDFGGSARYIQIPEGTTDYEINATVYGDIKIEPDEEFYVDLYAPSNLAIKDSRGVGVIINDDYVNFNIERVDSNKITPKNQYEQKEKEALYTQIAQRDFNYAIVSYDKNLSNFQEFPIENVTLKIELLDNNSTTSNILYTYYKYLDHKASRFNIIDEDKNELKLDASKDVKFRISYLEQNQSIVQGDFTNNTSVFDNNSSLRYTYARDNFAIRPAGFKLMLWADDGTIRDHLATSNQDDPNGIALAAGYGYELQVKAISDIGEVDTNYNVQYKSNSTSQEVNANLKFDGNKTSCNDTKDKDLKYYNFIGGINTNKELLRDNVGKFLIKVKDENWTDVDNKKGDCILNSSANEADNNGKYGCNIYTTFDIHSSDPTYNHYYDMRVYFQPYSFDVNFNVKSNNGNAHNDFLYMGDLNQDDSMAILIDGYITAKEKNGKTTTNFTKSCLAHQVDFSLDYNITTDRGLFNNPSSGNIIIKTIKTSQSPQGDIVTIQKREKHNNNGYLAISEDTVLDNNSTLLIDDFEDNEKGKTHLSILYNIRKSLNKPINPVKIKFNKVMVSSINSGSNLADNEINDFIPKGEQILNKSKVLYYGAVIPDRENYPDSFTKSSSTPLGVYIFCNHNRTFCNDMIGNNGLNNFRTQMGWYLSILHDSTVDGTINPLSQDSVTVTPNIIPNFNQGTKGRLNLQTNYTGGTIPDNTSIDTEVSINPSPWLKYHSNPARNGNPFWKNRWRGDVVGTMTGIGKAGNIIDIKANRTRTNRMDW
ncbi:MAG: hypothetical protein GXO60_00155 [Epsilonproteobacteria bacterium]|nr:hypothetical protein [Campylobacterota bacterium]